MSGRPRKRPDDRSGAVDLAVDGNGKARVAGGGLYLSNTIGSWVADTTLPWRHGVRRDGFREPLSRRLPQQPLHLDGLLPDGRDRNVGRRLDHPGASYDSPPDQPALAVDSAGKAYVVFAADGALVYLTNKSGAWSTQTSILSGGLSQPDIAVDAAGKIHIAYNRAGSNPGTYYATNATGSWVTTRLTRTYADQAPSIALGPTGKVYVAVSRDAWAANPGVYLITNRTGPWVTSLVRPSFGTRDASVAVGAGGLAGIAYDDPSSGISFVSETNPRGGLARQRQDRARGRARCDRSGSGSRARPDGSGTSSHPVAPGGANH